MGVSRVGQKHNTQTFEYIVRERGWWGAKSHILVCLMADEQSKESGAISTGGGEVR